MTTAPLLRFSFRVVAYVAPGIPIERRGGETLEFIPITGGPVSGEVDGEIIPGGGDWCVTRSRRRIRGRGPLPDPHRRRRHHRRRERRRGAHLRPADVIDGRGLLPVHAALPHRPPPTCSGSPGRSSSAGRVSHGDDTTVDVFEVLD